MTAQEGPPLDASTILEALNRHGVEYVVIGARAVEAQGIGRTRPTRDVDVTPLHRPRQPGAAVGGDP